MKKILLSSVLILLVLQAIAQQSFRLHVQPGKPQLMGDGDDYTTLVITARDQEGEVITSMNGKVAVRVSAGFCEAIEVNMQDGVAMVKYASPMFGTPIKASQRMVYFMFKFMQKFIARSAGSTNTQANQKLATDITIETFREGLIPVTLIPKKDGDNFAYIVCEMNGVKGKAKIEILKATEGRNGNIVPGVYSGRDITGQSDWKLNISSGGMGTWGEANGSEDDYNTIMFSNEVFTEMNDVLGKTAGMTGFLKAYIGPSWKETKYIENFDIAKQGMGSAYMPMPNNGVFIYVPPILFEYQGRMVSSTGSSQSGKPEEEIKTDKSGIVLSQNEIIGDGKSRTRAVFHYQDENGVPVSGKSISWSIPNGIKQISVQTVTDANGNAETVLEAPVLKATGEIRGENTGQIIDNYDLYKITVNYASPKRSSDYTEAYLSIYKTIERNIRILKPGFEAKSFKILLPQLEQFKLQSSVYALIEMINSPSIPDKTGVNDAVVFIERKKFDEESFNKYYDLYFKKDRKFFLDLIDSDKGGFYALTDKDGRFKLDIGINPDKKLSMEPLQAKLSDLTGRRKGSLGNVLKLFKDDVFTRQMIDKLFEMDKGLCALNHTQSGYMEEKLHILGNLMANTNSTSPMVKETTEAVIDASWELINSVAFFVNDKWKITEKLSEKTGLTAVQDKLQGYGADKVKLYIAKYGGNEIKGTLKAKMYKELYTRIFSISDKGKIKGVEYFYKGMGESVYNGMAKIFENFLEKVSNGLSEMVTSNITDPKGYITREVIDGYYKSVQQNITAYMATDPQKVHAVYERLQPMLKDKTSEFRSMYADVGKKRMDMGYYKADKDLLADLSKAAAVIGTVFITRDYATMVQTLDKIEKCSKALDGMMAGYNIYTEYGNYAALLQNVKFCFDLTLKSTSSGNIVTTENQGSLFLFNIFPSAYAGDSPGNFIVPGLSSVTKASLTASAGNIPFSQLAPLYENNIQFDNWLNSFSAKAFSMAAKDPELVAGIMKGASNYDNHLFTMAALTVSLAEEPGNPLLINAWNDGGSLLENDVSSLMSLGIKMTEISKSIPDNPTVILPEVSESGSIVTTFWRGKYLVYGVSALGALILTILLIVVIRKRKSKTQINQVNSLPLSPNTNHLSTSNASDNVNPVNTKSDISYPTSDIPTPKFCPQCGTNFKSGAKFCGKCGYKTQ